MCLLGPPETLQTEKLERNFDYGLTYQQRHRHRHRHQRFQYSTKDCVRFLPACFCFPNHDHELELERSRTLFQHTYVSTISLFFLFNIFAFAFAFLFQHLLALASHHDSHISRRSTRPLGLLALHTFFASIHSYTTSPPFLTTLLFSSLHALDDILRFLLSYVALTFTLLPCFDTIYSCSRFLLS